MHPVTHRRFQELQVFLPLTQQCFKEVYELSSPVCMKEYLMMSSLPRHYSFYLNSSFMLNFSGLISMWFLKLLMQQTERY